MRSKITLFAVAALALALSIPAEAQQAKKVYRIAYLEGGSASGSAHLLEAFREGLRKLGYVEGQNITIDYRYGEGEPDRQRQFAEELVRLKPDVIVVRTTDDALAAKKATSAIPIVMTNVGNPLDTGLVASLAKPGGNVTGVTQLTPELGGKRLELFKEVVPKMSRLAVLMSSRNSVGIQLQMKEVEAAAQPMGLKLQPLEARAPDELNRAFRTATSGRAGALIVLAAPPLFAERRRIGELAVKSRLPTMYPQSDYVDAGGLMSYGVNVADLYRRAAFFVDKILKGAKPNDLPVEQPTKFELVINLKAAKQIDLTIPPNMLARADKIIR